MSIDNSSQFQKGKALLAQPILPLVRLVQLLYLTGPFEKVSDILPALTEPIDTGAVLYDAPSSLLRPYLPILQHLEYLKNQQPLPVRICDERHEPLDAMEAIDLWVSQQIITAELEKINSLLCGPCHCTLCCTGPDADMDQLFFEIPLTETEKHLFKLKAIDTSESRRHKAMNEPALMINGKPFFENDSCLVRWQKGWSLILPKGTSCPNLDEKTGGCIVYPNRPQVCRRPQIFSYALEEVDSLHGVEEEEDQVPAYIARRKILAIWDCPYVQALKDEIAAYAEFCGMEPIFKTNKS